MPNGQPHQGTFWSQRRLVLLAVGAIGASCVMTQLALLRELLAAFSGNEMVLGVVLGLWLLLTGLGAFLWSNRARELTADDADGTDNKRSQSRAEGAWRSRFGERVLAPVHRIAGILIRVISVIRGFLVQLFGRRWSGNGIRHSLALLAAVQILLAILPLGQVLLLRMLRNQVFLPGATVGMPQTVASAFVLLLPYCLASGWALLLACSVLGREQGATGIGNVYVADSLGSIGGGLLFSFVLVRYFDHLTILVFPALLNLAVAALLGIQARRFWLWAAAAGLAAVVLAVAILVDLDGLCLTWQYPGQRVLARANSPYGKLVVTESDGQLNFLENGLPLTSTHDDQHVEETVHYALAQRPDARRVLLVSGGISGTAKEILKYQVSRVDYVELDPLILQLGQRYLPQNLADTRIHIVNADGRRFIQQTPEHYDVVIIAVPAPTTAQLNRFYTVEFLAEVKRILAPQGVVSFALGHYENYVSLELARMLSSAHQSLQRSYRHVLMVPGAQVFFLASDGPLFEQVAARLEQHGIKTKLVNRHYLEAMLTADRMMDMARAAAQPAALNHDFSPVLYYYHLRHWLSQFRQGSVLLQAVLLILLGVYLHRLRGSALVLFGSGFAGTSLEVVLLLAFQVLCGSVYHQVGVLVTVFMAGLALGAFVMYRFMPAVGGKGLALLALLIAAYAALLPVGLPWLTRAAALAGSLGLIKAVIAGLTLSLAVLVGMEFPLANRLEFDGTATQASRLYLADFVGAFLGAWLPCGLLLPLFGVTAVCLFSGSLNLLAALLQYRKALA